MQGINLNDLLKSGAEDYQDNTDHIRKIKHSPTIREEVLKLEIIRTEHKTNPVLGEHEYWNKCVTECPFLFRYYTDIFNRLYKSELNVSLMLLLLDELEKIENGEKTQEESSVLLGQILADIYANSSMLRGEKLDNDNKTEPKQYIQGSGASWKDWKHSTVYIDWKKKNDKEKEKEKKRKVEQEINNILRELNELNIDETTKDKKKKTKKN